FTLSPKRIDFGAVLINTKKVDSVIITNNGTSNLKISGTKSSSSKFTVSPTTATIQPGASLTVYITFAPTQVTVYSVRIVFTHNAMGTRDTVLVTGSSVIQPGSSISFG